MCHVLLLQAEDGRAEVDNVYHVLRLQSEDGRADVDNMPCPPAAGRRWLGKGRQCGPRVEAEAGQAKVGNVCLARSHHQCHLVVDIITMFLLQGASFTVITTISTIILAFSQDIVTQLQYTCHSFL